MIDLGGFRAAVADALDGLDPDWTVHAAPVDAVEPPAFLLVWADPWLIPGTFCTATAQLDAIAVAARLEPEANYPTLEAMVAAASVALADASLSVVQTGAPGPMEIAQVQYLAARVLVRQSVDLRGGS